jgi:hypothetical protein
MGMREWESGKITLSTSDFPKFRKIIVDELNERQEELLKKAQAIHADLVAKHEAEKDRPLSDRVRDRLDQLQKQEATSANLRWLSRPSKPGITWSERGDLQNALIGESASAKQDPYQLRKPSRDAFALKEVPATGSPDRTAIRAYNQLQNVLFVQAKVLHAHRCS